MKLILADMIPLGAAVLIGVLRWSRLTFSLRALTIYLAVVFVIETLSKLHVYRILDFENLYLLHIYTPLEFVLISLVYGGWFIFSKRQRWWFGGYVVIVTLCILIYSAYQLLVDGANDPTTFQLYSKAAVNGSIIAYASLFALQALRFPALFLGSDTFVLHINSAMLVYFSGSFIIFFAINYILQSDIAESIYFWLINVILTFVMHLVCLIGLWRQNRSR